MLSLSLSISPYFIESKHQKLYIVYYALCSIMRWTKQNKMNIVTSREKNRTPAISDHLAV